MAIIKFERFDGMEHTEVIGEVLDTGTDAKGKPFTTYHNFITDNVIIFRGTLEQMLERYHWATTAIDWE